MALLDTYRMNDSTIKRWDTELSSRSFTGIDTGTIGFEEITAFAWICSRLLIDWGPGDLDTPVLLLRATVPLAEGEEGMQWQTDLPQMSAVVDVPGDHFSILENEDVPFVAQTVHRWLTDIEHPAEGE